MNAGCGTYGGYQRHRRRGEPRCEPCQAAAAAYAARRRIERPDTYAGELEMIKARDRALTRLGHEYPERYQELVNEENLRWRRQAVTS